MLQPSHESVSQFKQSRLKRIPTAILHAHPSVQQITTSMATEIRTNFPTFQFLLSVLNIVSAFSQPATALDTHMYACRNVTVTLKKPPVAVVQQIPHHSTDANNSGQFKEQSDSLLAFRP